MAAVSSTLAAEFAHLKERAQSLFEGLRDLPPFGQKLWEPYFHRTFEVYNKLWSERLSTACRPRRYTHLTLLTSLSRTADRRASMQSSDARSTSADAHTPFSP